MGVGGHQACRGKRPVNQKEKRKKKKSSQYLYSSPKSVLPAGSRQWWQRQTRCLSHCCRGSGPGQGRENGCWGEEAPGLVASCPLSAAWPGLGKNGAGSPSSSRQEQQWQRMGHNAARHEFPHASQWDIAWLGLSRFQEQHPAPCGDWQIKGVVLPRHGRFNGCRGGFYLWSRTQRQERWLGARNGCPLHHLPSVRGGSGLPQGCEELGRTGTFSKCGQREPGFPTNW